MTLRHRITLLLLALPFSGALAVTVFFLVDLSLSYRLAAAAALFIVSELTLQHLASRIPSRTGPEAMHGANATVIADFDDDGEGVAAGYVRVRGERWRAHAPLHQRGLLRAGATARIVRVQGLTLWVSPPD
jgi:membrane protein implicated in regulation of membrane protease activity